MDKKTILISSASSRIEAHCFLDKIPVGWQVTFRPKKRDIVLNDKMWPMLRDISQQVIWYGEWLTEEEYKDIFTAALKRSKIRPGLDGGFVVIGGHTSKMSNEEMSDMIELMYQFGAERNVQWSDDVERR